MKPHSKLSSDACVLWRVLFMILGLNSIPLVLQAVTPSWWEPQKVLRQNAGQVAPPSDFSAVNQGQLKNMAVGAYEYLLTAVPAGLVSASDPGGVGVIRAANGADKGSVGWRLRQLVSGWVDLDSDGAVIRDGSNHRVLAAAAVNGHQDFKVVNQGQLKAVAKLFYERLNEIYSPFGYSKPWTDDDNPLTTSDTEDDVSFAVANLGQLKNIFSFDLARDSDDDGMSDLAELVANVETPLGGTPLDPFSSDSDHDGVLDGAETLTSPHLADTDGDGNSDFDNYQLPRPTGLRIRFPDATVNPKDPDMSKIRVEWNAPNDPEINQVTVEHTYAGSPVGWEVKANLAPAQTSQNFDGLLSKRRYLYRVVFRDTAGRTSSAAVQYELPAIRALMIRERFVQAEFQGPLLYPAYKNVGIPRKFRKYSSVTETKDETKTYSNGILNSKTVKDHRLEFSVEHDVPTGYRKRHEYEHALDELTFPNDAASNISKVVHKDLTKQIHETLPQSTSGSAATVVDDYTDDLGYDATDRDLHTTKGVDDHINFTVQPVNIAISTPTVAPLSSLSGNSLHTDTLDVFGLFDSYGTSDTANAALSLGTDGVFQIPVWNGTFVHVDPPNNSTSPHGGVFPDYSTRGFVTSLGDFESDFEFEVGETPTMTTTTTGNGFIWEAKFEDSGGPANSTYSKKTTTTATWEDEVSTNDFLQQVVALSMPFASIDWNSRDTLWSNSCGAVLGDALFSALDWSHTVKYLPSYLGEELETEIDGDRVDFDPQFDPTIGFFDLQYRENFVHMVMTEYKYRLYPSAQAYDFVWIETFMPAPTSDCPPGWVAKPQTRLRQFTVQPGDSETQAQTIENTKGFSVVEAGNAPNHLQDVFVRTPSVQYNGDRFCVILHDHNPVSHVLQQVSSLYILQSVRALEACLRNTHEDH